MDFPKLLRVLIVALAGGCIGCSRARETSPASSSASTKRAVEGAVVDNDTDVILNGDAAARALKRTVVSLPAAYVYLTSAGNESEFRLVCVHRRYSADNDLYCFGFVDEVAPGTDFPRQFVIDFPLIFGNARLVSSYESPNDGRLLTMFKTGAPEYPQVLVVGHYDLLRSDHVFQGEGKGAILTAFGAQMRVVLFGKYPDGRAAGSRNYAGLRFGLAGRDGVGARVRARVYENLERKDEDDVEFPVLNGSIGPVVFPNWIERVWPKKEGTKKGSGVLD